MPETVENETCSGVKGEEGAWASLQHLTEVTTAHRRGAATHLVKQVETTLAISG